MKVLWNFSLQTDHQLVHNKLDDVSHGENDNDVLIIMIQIVKF